MPERVKVTIEFLDVLGLGDRAIRLLMMDALYEFVSHRGPTSEEYVNQRYPDTPDYAWLNRQAKITEVDRRIITAQAMHSCVEVETVK